MRALQYESKIACSNLHKYLEVGGYLKDLSYKVQTQHKQGSIPTYTAHERQPGGLNDYQYPVEVYLRYLILQLF